MEAHLQQQLLERADCDSTEMDITQVLVWIKSWTPLTRLYRKKGSNVDEVQPG
jgi:hypothetical protein